MFLAQMMELLYKTLVVVFCLLFFFCKFYAKILIYIHNYHSPHAQGFMQKVLLPQTLPHCQVKKYTSHFLALTELSREWCKRFSVLLLFKLKRKKKKGIFSAQSLPFLFSPSQPFSTTRLLHGCQRLHAISKAGNSIFFHFYLFTPMFCHVILFQTQIRFLGFFSKVAS